MTLAASDLPKEVETLALATEAERVRAAKTEADRSRPVSTPRCRLKRSLDLGDLVRDVKGRWSAYFTALCWRATDGRPRPLDAGRPRRPKYQHAGLIHPTNPEAVEPAQRRGGDKREKN